MDLFGLLLKTAHRGPMGICLFVCLFVCCVVCLFVCVCLVASPVCSLVFKQGNQKDITHIGESISYFETNLNDCLEAAEEKTLAWISKFTAKFDEDRASGPGKFGCELVFVFCW